MGALDFVFFHEILARPLNTTYARTQKQYARKRAHHTHEYGRCGKEGQNATRGYCKGRALGISLTSLHYVDWRDSCRSVRVGYKNCTGAAVFTIASSDRSGFGATSERLLQSSDAAKLANESSVRMGIGHETVEYHFKSDSKFGCCCKARKY